MVEFQSELVVIEWNREVVAVEVVGQVRRGEESLREFLRYSIQPRSGDDVVGKRSALRVLHRDGFRSRHRPARREAGLREVTAALGHARQQNVGPRCPVALAPALIGKEEEGLVPPVVTRQPYRPADGAAELVFAQRGFTDGEEVARIQLVVTQELLERPVEVVGPRFGHHIHHHSRVPAMHGGIGILQNGKLLERVWIRKCRGQVVKRIQIDAAVEKVARGIRPRPVHRGAESGVQRDQRCRLERPRLHRPGQQVLQLQRLASIEWQIHHSGRVDHFLDGGAEGVHRCSVSAYRDGLTHLAYLQADVDPGALVYLQQNALTNELAKTLLFAGDRVEPGRQTREDEVAVGVRSHRAADLRVGLGCRDRYSGKYGPG